MEEVKPSPQSSQSLHSELFNSPAHQPSPTRSSQKSIFFSSPSSKGKRSPLATMTNPASPALQTNAENLPLSSLKSGDLFSDHEPVTQNFPLSSQENASGPPINFSQPSADHQFSQGNPSEPPINFSQPSVSPSPSPISGGAFPTPPLTQAPSTSSP